MPMMEVELLMAAPMMEAELRMKVPPMEVIDLPGSKDRDGTGSKTSIFQRQ